jgi:DNA-binding HxlR family transcriptional regulator
LGLVKEGLEAQSEIIAALKGQFAPRTVLDSLHLLADVGALDRRKADATFRAVRYSVTDLGHALLGLPLGSIKDHLARSNVPERP